MNKKILLLFCLSALLITTTACSDEAVNQADNSEAGLDPVWPDPVNMHTGYEQAYAKYQMMDAMLANNSVDSTFALSSAQEQQLNAAIQLYSDSESVLDVLDHYGIDEDVYFAADYYSNHSQDANVLDDVESLFPNLSQNQLKTAYDMYFYSKIIRDRVANGRTIKTSCAVAIAGAVVSCAAAVSIGNVAGLCWWTVTYGFSLYSLVDTCSKR